MDLFNNYSILEKNLLAKDNSIQEENQNEEKEEFTLIRETDTLKDEIKKEAHRVLEKLKKTQQRKKFEEEIMEKWENVCKTEEKIKKKIQQKKIWLVEESQRILTGFSSAIFENQKEIYVFQEKLIQITEEYVKFSEEQVKEYYENLEKFFQGQNDPICFGDILNSRMSLQKREIERSYEIRNVECKYQGSFFGGLAMGVGATGTLLSFINSVTDACCNEVYFQGIEMLMEKTGKMQFYGLFLLVLGMGIGIRNSQKQQTESEFRNQVCFLLKQLRQKTQELGDVLLGRDIFCIEQFSQEVGNFISGNHD